jgi:hypothetical protein
MHKRGGKRIRMDWGAPEEIEGHNPYASNEM